MKPWEKEDWRKAKGIIVEEGQTNSALADRDYSVPCEAPGENLILVVKGYWIWWCSAHHQPLCHCEHEKANLEAKTTAKKLIDWLRDNPNYKVTVRLVRGGYRNMSHESDWDLLREELGIEKRKEAKHE